MRVHMHVHMHLHLRMRMRMHVHAHNLHMHMQVEADWSGGEGKLVSAMAGLTLTGRLKAGSDHIALWAGPPQRPTDNLTMRVEGSGPYTGGPNGELYLLRGGALEAPAPMYAYRGVSVGSQVELHDLRSTAFNCQRGTVVGPMVEGRYPVEVVVGGAKKRIRVRLGRHRGFEEGVRVPAARVGLLLGRDLLFCSLFNGSLLNGSLLSGSFL